MGALEVREFSLDSYFQHLIAAQLQTRPLTAHNLSFQILKKGINIYLMLMVALRADREIIHLY